MRLACDSTGQKISRARTLRALRFQEHLFSMADQHAQLVVLGGGPGGYPAAFAAADHGMKVVLIDEGDRKSVV